MRQHQAAAEHIGRDGEAQLDPQLPVHPMVVQLQKPGNGAPLIHIIFVLAQVNQEIHHIVPDDAVFQVLLPAPGKSVSVHHAVHPQIGAQLAFVFNHMHFLYFKAIRSGLSFFFIINFHPMSVKEF